MWLGLGFGGVLHDHHGRDLLLEVGLRLTSLRERIEERRPDAVDMVPEVARDQVLLDGRPIRLGGLGDFEHRPLEHEADVVG